MKTVEDFALAVLAALFALLGVGCFVGFLVTWAWHCLLFAVMCTGMVYVWYYEDYKSNGKKLSTLWQKKNTKH